MNKRFGLTLGVALLCMVPAACSSDDGGASTTSGASTSGATTPDTTTATTASGSETTVAGTDSATNDSVVLESTPEVPESDPPAQENLPGDGAATVGGVSLPAGRVIITSDQRLTWITDSVVPGTGAVWLQLLAASADTGLYPIIVRNDDQKDGWWNEQLFPNQPAEIPNMKLEDALSEAGEFNFDPPRTFTALAPASSGTADEAAADAAITGLPDGRIALVQSTRGGDALSFMGWTGNATYGPTESMSLAANSWAERYGARVVAVGPNSLTLAIANPPATSAEAAALTAEMVLLDPDLETGGAPIPVVATGDGLLTLRLWTFWWS